jgi:hypothetical protein
MNFNAVTSWSHEFDIALIPIRVIQNLANNRCAYCGNAKLKI